MHRDVGAPVLRRLHRGAQLGDGVLRDVERVVARGDPAARHQLDLRGAERELLARPQADRVRAVGDGGGADPLAEGEVAGAGRQLVRQPEVAVAAGLRDEGARGPDPRAGDEPRVDAPLEPEDGPAEVADAREPAHQHVGRGLRRGDVHEADVAREDVDLRHGREHDVRVRVDQPRHQRPAAAGDPVSAAPLGAATGAVEIVLMTFPTTRTFDGAESRSDVPSKTRTFSKAAKEIAASRATTAGKVLSALRPQGARAAVDRPGPERGPPDSPQKEGEPAPHDGARQPPAGRAVSRVALLDVNVLVALFDPDHVHHEAAPYPTASAIARSSPAARSLPRAKPSCGDPRESRSCERAVRLRGLGEKRAKVLGVPRAGPVVPAEDLQGDQVTERGDRDDEAGKDFDRLGCGGDLRLDSRGREEEVDHDAARPSFQRRPEANGGEAAGRVLLDRADDLPARRRELPGQALARGVVGDETATSTSRVVRGSARAETASPPTSAQRTCRRFSASAIARRASSRELIGSEATGPAGPARRRPPRRGESLSRFPSGPRSASSSREGFSRRNRWARMASATAESSSARRSRAAGESGSSADRSTMPILRTSPKAGSLGPPGTPHSSMRPSLGTRRRTRAGRAPSATVSLRQRSGVPILAAGGPRPTTIASRSSGCSGRVWRFGSRPSTDCRPGSSHG